MNRRTVATRREPMHEAASAPETYVYRITPDDVIEFVNDSWLRFAVANDAPRLVPEVLGSSLWKHISGPQVVHLSRELLTRVRASRCEVYLPFRCDSPR